MAGETGQFQYAFDIDAMLSQGFSMEQIVEQAIEVRNKRVEKNAQHVSYQDIDNKVNGQAECSLSIVAIPRDQPIFPGESGSIEGVHFKNAQTLMALDASFNLTNIPYQLVASVLPDNTLFLPRAFDAEVEKDVLSPFRQKMHQHVSSGNFVSEQSLREEFNNILIEEESSEQDKELVARKAVYMSNFTFHFVNTLGVLEYDAAEIAEMEQNGVLTALYENGVIDSQLCTQYGIDESCLLAPNAIRFASAAWASVMKNIRDAVDGEELSDDELREEVAQFAKEMVQLVVESYREGSYEVSFEALKARYLNKIC